MAAQALDFLILGLLCERELTGYEIQRTFRAFPINVGSRSFGSIYPALRKLERLGFINTEHVLLEGKPGKRTAHITESGREAFLQWLRTPLPVGAPSSGRDPFSEKFLFFGKIPPDEAARLCQRHLEDMIALRFQVNGFAYYFQDSLDRFARWNLQGGIAVLNARIAWLEEVCSELGRRPRDSEGG